MASASWTVIVIVILQPERLQCLQILVILAASSAEFKVDTIEDDDDRPSSVSSAARPSGPTFCALITPMRLMMATDSNGVGGGSRLLSMYSWRCESLSESVISTMAMSSSASLSPPLCFLGKFGKFAAILNAGLNTNERLVSSAWWRIEFSLSVGKMEKHAMLNQAGIFFRCYVIIQLPLRQQK